MGVGADAAGVTEGPAAFRVGVDGGLAMALMAIGRGMRGVEGERPGEEEAKDLGRCVRRRVPAGRMVPSGAVRAEERLRVRSAGMQRLSKFSASAKE